MSVARRGVKYNFAGVEQRFLLAFLVKMTGNVESLFYRDWLKKKKKGENNIQNIYISEKRPGI